MVATPDEYLAAVPEIEQRTLMHLRSLIQESVPALREDIRWGMLCYETVRVVLIHVNGLHERECRTKL